MRPGELGAATPRHPGGEPAYRADPAASPADPGWIIETEVSPFHCLYQDALFFHSQSRLIRARSESESSRYARAAFLAYLSAAEALVHQAAIDLTRPEAATLVADPTRPLPLEKLWRLLPSITSEMASGGSTGFDLPPWPQFAELIALRNSWTYPGPASVRKAYYRAPNRTSDYEPLQAHQAPAELRIASHRLTFPRTGLPRDPYALRPEHLDTARSVIDAAVEALDRRMGGALTRDNRHRREPVRVVYPADNGRGG